MDAERLAAILNAVARGEATVEAAMEQLKSLPFENLGFANIDLHRTLRQGMPEVIFCPGKQIEQIIAIANQLRKHHALVIATRADQEVAERILELDQAAEYDASARVLYWGTIPGADPQLPTVAVVTAGTADLPVADEAAFVLSTLRVPVVRLNDVGVAGIHRLLNQFDRIRHAQVTIVVAGMDGALPSVVAGMAAGPVIAVPTSVGYGAAFEGLAALLTMLNSCAAGVTVVNIDNGFGAAVAAHRLISTLPIVGYRVQ
ncbi:MAG: nickel pincer cofactor biosynthesis protein LarB [Candidatus Obscuribacterales bacterium]